MEPIYELPWHVRYCDVDAHGRLRLSTLLTQWQECGMAQMTQWGQTNAFTMDQGLLWIVSRQQVVIDRLPGMDEDTVLRTWVGDCRHGLFPRSYELSAADGTILAKASAQWTLMHADTRTIEMKPGEYGVSLPPCVTGRELPRQKTLRAMAPERTGDFTVPYSCLDANGHMNNARYLDLAGDVLPRPGRPVTALRIEYHHEVRLGEVLRWGAAALDGAPEESAANTPAAGTDAAPQTDAPAARTYYFEGAVGEQPCFRAEITFGAR